MVTDETGTHRKETRLAQNEMLKVISSRQNQLFKSRQTEHFIRRGVHFNDSSRF